MNTRADADDFIYGESQVVRAGVVGAAAGHTPGRAALLLLVLNPLRETGTRSITGGDEVLRQLEVRFFFLRNILSC